MFAGGGMAQVDAKVPVTVYDCSSGTDLDGNAFDQANCAAAVPPPNGPVQGRVPQKKLDAWKKLGQGFAAAGGGVVFAFKEQIGVQLNVNGMYMLGSSGPVIEPSLGFVYGL